MRSLILIPDGTSLRNVVFGGVLANASARGEVFAFHTAPDSLLPVYQKEASREVVWQRMPAPTDPPIAFLLRNALNTAQSRWAGTFSSRYRVRRRASSWRMEHALRVARFVGGMSATRPGIQRLQKWSHAAAARAPEVRWFVSQFEQLRPSLLFCSQQMSLATVAPVLAARSLGIPTATFIFSWDNLTTKGHIAAPFDHYLVWSDHMRLELLHYYPEVSPSAVHVVGSPQFDPYARPDLLWSREEFFARIHADPDRPLICYSGGDVRTCPDDQAHVRILLDLVRRGAIHGKPQVALRPTPVDEGTRYASVRHDYPELIVLEPAWVHNRNGDWGGVMPLPADVRMLVNLVHHASLNVNVASTMTLDFAVNDRPIVNIAFDVTSPPPHGRALWHHYYQYDHYRPVVDLKAARFACSPEQLADHVNAYLADPGLERDGRRRLVNMQLRGPCGRAAERIADVLEGIAS